MFIRLETSSGVPITRQVADQVRAQVASGALAAGDRLPSVRALAAELAVNQNTVLRVYERLTLEGLLERRHGDGTYVAAASGEARRAKAQMRQQRELLEAEAGRFVQRGLTLGVKADELHAMIDRAAERVRREAPVAPPP